MGADQEEDNNPVYSLVKDLEHVVHSLFKKGDIANTRYLLSTIQAMEETEDAYWINPNPNYNDNFTRIREHSSNVGRLRWLAPRLCHPDTRSILLGIHLHDPIYEMRWKTPQNTIGMNVKTDIGTGAGGRRVARERERQSLCRCSECGNWVLSEGVLT